MFSFNLQFAEAPSESAWNHKILKSFRSLLRTLEFRKRVKFNLSTLHAENASPWQVSGINLSAPKLHQFECDDGSVGVALSFNKYNSFRRDYDQEALHLKCSSAQQRFVFDDDFPVPLVLAWLLLIEDCFAPVSVDVAGPHLDLSGALALARQVSPDLVIPAWFSRLHVGVGVVPDWMDFRI